jgi:ribulose 1,5-bisphosphate synthetase/thiazole synthase
VLADPTNAEVAEALGAHIRPAETTYDVVIVGAGPAGLAAAVYGSSEGLRTALLERRPSAARPGRARSSGTTWASRAGLAALRWLSGRPSRP